MYAFSAIQILSGFWCFGFLGKAQNKTNKGHAAATTPTISRAIRVDPNRAGIKNGGLIPVVYPNLGHLPIFSWTDKPPNFVPPSFGPTLIARGSVPKMS